MSEGSDIGNETPVKMENIKRGNFLLVKSQRKRLFYITLFSIKFNFRQKSWVPRNVYIYDVVCILPQCKSASIAKTAYIFNFEKDLSVYNVQ